MSTRTTAQSEGLSSGGAAIGILLSSSHVSVAFFGRSATELADVISQAVLHIARLVKPPLHQLFDPLLRGRPHDRGKAHVPFRSDLEVGRQTCHVGEALGLADRPLVERGYACR